MKTGITLALLFALAFAPTLTLADSSTHRDIAELDYLEKSIGKTGILAMQPFLHMERKDLWQLNILEGGTR